ncbi:MULTISPECIES: hypothetical protein [unclassified Stenotrophomonas]|uniref:hypothetical protein n=1 Tax=unclassified Stenotrophomonas TaxID=196198 RepID=UPI002448A335|nr:MULTISPECIES: hypothetical protein [unclassified Stenotrophomonas]MBN5158728.1 hypothetical protein [Stenotrophomonas maltophilia]MDG9844919.1 hypothetical protein [Stenotrophomonas sp. GD04054]MDH0016851.1 hypothetical protein [Stenotrophomonas sp. GD04028]MDH0577331.1 hypothetical protein [Stenotrophomonas sp. GD03997]MDH0860218.1 hypothetical protein [Stenotrophomonas sp. GD03882]
MKSAILIFAIAGFAATYLFFIAIKLLFKRNENFISTLLSLVLGIVIIFFTPAQDVAVKTLGDLASSAAGLIWSFTFMIAWIVGLACAHVLLDKFRN